MVDDFRLIRNPVGLLVRAPEVAEGFEVAVVHPDLPFTSRQEVGGKIVAATGREVADGHAALSPQLQST